MVTCKVRVAAAFLLAACVSAPDFIRPAHASPFTEFAADEDVCRSVGAAAIRGASGPAAARLYDVAHGQCMIAHGRMRQAAGRPAPFRQPASPPSDYYPDAFTSIPYATPGYGYDGFSY